MYSLINGVIYCSMAYWLENGPALVSENNVLKVILTDCIPRASLWRTDLPDCILRKLPSGIFTMFAGQFIAYESEYAAMNALSQACILWASAVREAE